MNVSDYQAPLRGVVAIIARLLTQLAQMFIPRVQDQEQRLIVEGLIGASRKTVEALSDADPNDKAQLQTILNDLLSEGPFRKGSQAEVLARINTLSNEDVRLFLTILNQESYVIADVLTDKNPANDEQMEAYLSELLRGGKGVALIRAILGIILRNDQYADTGASLVVQLLILSLEDEGQRDTAEKEDLVALQQTYDQRVLEPA